MAGHYPDQVGLLIGLPLSGRLLVPEFTFAFHALNPPMNFNLRYGYTKGAPTAESRNYLANLAIKEKCKYLFFLDEDVTPPPHALRHLIAMAEHHPDVWMIGGVYCHKQDPPAPMVFRGNGSGPYWDWKLGEFFWVTGVSMGCTLIRTSIFEDLEKPWFVTVDDSSPMLDAVNHAEQWTEDLYFCEKLRKREDYYDGRIMVDGYVICEHWNVHTNPPRPVSLPKWSMPFRLAGVVKGDKKIVDLGSGEAPYQTDEGVPVTVDIREEVFPDYRNDLRHLSFGNEEFDIVRSSHTLEHFSRDEVPKVLDEWIRVMKKDGELRLVVPNLKWAAKQILEGSVDKADHQTEGLPAWNSMNVLYGEQGYKQNFHMMGFTPESLAALLKSKGFKRVDVGLVGFNICIRAWLNPPSEEDVPELGAKPSEIVMGKEGPEVPSPDKAENKVTVGELNQEQVDTAQLDAEDRMREQGVDTGTSPLPTVEEEAAEKVRLEKVDAARQKLIEQDVAEAVGMLAEGENKDPK